MFFVQMIVFNDIVKLCVVGNRDTVIPLMVILKNINDKSC